MLVLSRKESEKIMIGDDIEVVVVEIRGDKVRLGIVAPDSTPVHREEIYNAIRDGVPVKTGRVTQSARTPESPE